LHPLPEIREARAREIPRLCASGREITLTTDLAFVWSDPWHLFVVPVARSAAQRPLSCHVGRARAAGTRE
jgi:hypothetical protein